MNKVKCQPTTILNRKNINPNSRRTKTTSPTVRRKILRRSLSESDMFFLDVRISNIVA